MHAAPTEIVNLRELITGLASDLADLRAGRITIHEARVRAELGKQVFNGMRLVLSGQKYLEASLKPVPQPRQLNARKRNGHRRAEAAT